MIAKRLAQPELVSRSTTVFGQMLVLLDNRERAIESFLFIRDLAEERGEPSLACEAYRLVALARQESKDHRSALLYFKKIL